MGVESILEELEAERERVGKAIAILRGSSVNGRRFLGSVRRRRRPLSVAAKRRISQGMKKRWAERKKASAKTG
jgi:hypothetical protein